MQKLLTLDELKEARRLVSESKESLDAITEILEAAYSINPYPADPETNTDKAEAPAGSDFECGIV